MITASREKAVYKLAIAGQRAGLPIEQMIQLLESGMSVITLLDLITWRLDHMGSKLSSKSRLSVVQSITRRTMDRYLQFDNIDMELPDVCSRCSQCGQTFSAQPKPTERVDDVLLRIREQFNAHQC